MIKTKFPFNVILDFPKEGREERYLDELNEIAIHIEISKKPNLKKVDRFFQRWKKYPEVWNYYYGALVKNNRHSEAEKLLQRTREEFPDYFYGYGNYAKRLIHFDKLEEAINILGGDTPDIQRWYPDKNTFWIEHVVQYYLLFIELEIKRGNYDKARDYIKYVEDCFSLNDMNNLAVNNKEAKEVGEYVHNAFRYVNSEIKFHIATKMSEMWENHNSKKPKYIQPVLPNDYKNKHQTVKGFNHPEIEMLFEWKTLDKETINTILSLHRATAIADLERIMYLAMFEFTDEDLARNQYYALLHTLWFLSEFNAVETMESACLLLQMDTNFTDYWFGDFWVDESWFYFYMLLKHDHGQLMKVLYLPNKDAHVKCALLEAINQFAYYHSERKDEAIGWLSDLLQFYVDNRTNDDITDAIFISFLESSLIDLNVESSLPNLKILHEADCVDETMNGNFKEVEEYIKNPHLVNQMIKPLQNIFTLAEGEKQWYDKVEKEDNMDLITQPNLLSSAESNTQNTKTGRNEPCSCGSGKKYKKCCGG